MPNKKLEESLNSLLEDGLTDGLELDFDDETPVPSKEVVEEVVKHEEVKSRRKTAINEPSKPQPFISETFSNLMSGVEKEKKQITQEERIATFDILNGIKVDLSSIQIVSDVPEADLKRASKEILGATKTMQVVCCQSAYSANMSALRNQEIQNVNNINSDLYTFKKTLYKALWDHVETTSVGKMDFNTWLKVTSFFDVETLLYGAYCMTFPYENKYPIRCPKTDCGRHFDTVVNNNTLVETRGDGKIFAKINEVISNVNKAEQLVANSHVHTTERVMMDESKIIFDIQIPSLYDYLENILGKVRYNEEYAEKNSQSLGLALFIKQALLPDIDHLRETGQLRYIPLDDRTKLIELIAGLPYFDGQDLAERIDKFSENLHIVYSIKGVKCPECGYEFPDIPMDMENVLFTVIRTGKRD